MKAFLQLVVLLVIGSNAKLEMGIDMLVAQCADNPQSSELCDRISQAFPKLQMRENYLSDPLGLLPPPYATLDFAKFIQDFEYRAGLDMEEVDEEVKNCMYEMYLSMSKGEAMTEECVDLLLTVEAEEKSYFEK